MGVLRQKRDWQSVTARIFDVPDEWMETRVKALPFELTGAQKHAVDDIVVDLGSGRPMNRLAYDATVDKHRRQPPPSSTRDEDLILKPADRRKLVFCQT